MYRLELPRQIPVFAALHEDEVRVIEQLYLQGVENGVIGIEMCSRERMLELEPKLNPEVVGGLYAPSGGILEPYRFVFSLVESAEKNGVEIKTQFEVISAVREGDCWRIIAADGREIEARFVVNSAGLYADTISAAFGGERFEIVPRKGEYYLLDRTTKAKPSRVIFPRQGGFCNEPRAARAYTAHGSHDGSFDFRERCYYQFCRAQGFLWQ